MKEAEEEPQESGGDGPCQTWSGLSSSAVVIKRCQSHPSCRSCPGLQLQISLRRNSSSFNAIVLDVRYPRLFRTASIPLFWGTVSPPVQSPYPSGPSCRWTPPHVPRSDQGTRGRPWSCLPFPELKCCDLGLAGDYPPQIWKPSVWITENETARKCKRQKEA